MEQADPIAQLEADLEFHQSSDTGLRFEGEVCLRFDLIQAWGNLVQERDALVQESAGSLAEADTSKIDAAIELAAREIEPYILKLRFKAITGPVYADLLDEHPGVLTRDPRAGDLAAFRRALSEACFLGSTYRGEEVTAEQLPLERIRDRVSFGEMEDIDARVHGMNRRTFDRDFLSERSKPTPTS